MNEEQIKALIAAALKDFGTQVVPGLMASAIKPLGDQMQGIATSLDALKPDAAAKAAADKAAADKAAADKAAADKAAADAAAKAGLTPEANAMLLDMKRSNERLAADLKALTDQKAEADKRADQSERMAQVNTALAGFQFANDAARQTAVDKVMGQIKRTDAGTLVAGDNLTVEAFVKDYLPTQHAYLLAPVNAGGAGITPGTGSRGASKAVDLDSIKPGMSVEDRAAAVAAIAQAGVSLK